MSASFTIQLHQLRFYAPHGVFEEEALTGNTFEIDLWLTVKAPKQTITSLHHTINYAAAYQLVQESFSVRTPLLETLAMEMAAKLKAAFPALKKISLRITKLHPPISGFTGAVAVCYKKKYSR